METRLKWIRRRVLTLALAVVGVAAIAGTAVAGHQTSGVKSYTGCLTPGDGPIIKIKEGNSPRSACTGGAVEVHFSGGDISKISVGNGLSLPNGGDNGEVRIELAAGQALPQGCTDEQVAEWDSSTSRWACGVDDDTTYSAGTGLDLSAANQFSIEPDYRVKNAPDCSSGQFATGFDGDGDIQCAAPPAAQGVQGYSAAVGFVALAGPTTVISKTLPAGTYLLFASVELRNQDTDSESGGTCSIPGYESEYFSLGENLGDQVGWTESISMASAITHSGGAVALSCEEGPANVDVSRATLNAIKLDSIG